MSKEGALFTLAEISLAGLATFFAIKNTKKYIEDKPKKEQTAKEKAKDIAKHYWPTAVCYCAFVVLDIADGIKTEHTKSAYAKALMAAQGGILAKAKNVKENLEEKKQEVKDIHDGVIDPTNSQYTLFFDPDDLPEHVEKSVYAVGRKKTQLDLFYIPQLGVLFQSDLYNVNQAAGYCIAQLSSGNEMTINEVMKYLGLGNHPLGKTLYFEPDSDNGEPPFSFDLSPAMTEDDNSILFYVINFNRDICNKDLESKGLW